MYKLIKIPESALIDAGGGERRGFPFADFLRGRLNDSAFGRSRSTLEARAELQKAFAEAKPGDIVSVRRADWEILAVATENPQPPYLPAITGQVLHYLSVILDAPVDEVGQRRGERAS